MMDFEYYMSEALKQARLAYNAGEAPVGAVVVYDGAIIGRGHNRREIDADALAHAELMAISEANKAIGKWRLSGCSLFVTLEPCPMCAGAIINSRIDSVVFGARDPKAGACGSVINLFEEAFNHKPKVYAGIMSSECGLLLSEFFKTLR